MNNNKRYITIKPLQLDTFEKLLKRGTGDKTISNKVPDAVHFFEPAISQSTGRYMIDTSWINYELLGIKKEKPDDGHIAQLLMAKAAAISQRRDTFHKELQKVYSEKYDLQTKLDELSVKMSNCDRTITDLDKQVDTELKKDKRSDTKISGLKEKKEKEQDTKQEFFAEWQLTKDLLASKEKREAELITEERTPDNTIVQIEQEIIKARQQNVFTDKELQDQIAVRYTTNSNSNLDTTITADSVWSKLERVRLSNEDLVFDMSDIKATLQLCALVGAGLVAKSNKIEDTLSGKYEYYIYDTEIEIKSDLAIRKSKEAAYSTKSMLTQEVLRDILSIHGISSYGLSESQVEQRIYDLIDKDSEGFLKTAKLQNTDRMQQRTVHDLKAYGIIVDNDLGTGYKIASTGQIINVSNLVELTEYLHGANHKDGLLRTLINDLDNKKNRVINSYNFSY